MPTIEQIEDAMLTALNQLKTAGDLKTLDTYGGQLDEEALEALAPLMPAVFIVYTGSEPTEDFPREYDVLASWDVLLVSGDLRGEKARRKGAGTGKGAYDLLEDIKTKLAGKTLGLTITPLSWKEDRAVLVGKIVGRPLSIYSQSYETRFDYSATP